MHQRTRDVQQAAAPQNAVRQFENAQAHRVGAGRFVISDKALCLQRPEDVVRRPTMQTRRAGHLARVQRTLGRMQHAENFRRGDDRTNGFSERADPGDLRGLGGSRRP